MTETLREFETRLLLAIHELDDHAFGLSTHEYLEAAPGRALSLRQIYTGPARLEQRALVASSAGESTAGRGGRRRKYDRLQPAALGELRSTAKTFRELAEAISGNLPGAAEARS